MKKHEKSVGSHAGFLLLALLTSIMTLLSACGQNPTSGDLPSQAVSAIYVLDSAGLLKAIRHDDGKLLWQQRIATQGYGYSGVLTVANQVVYVVQSGEMSSTVTALDSTHGSFLWHTQVPLVKDSSGMLRQETVKVVGNILVAEIDGGQPNLPRELYALRTDTRALLWETTESDSCCRGLTVVSRDTISLVTNHHLATFQTSTVDTFQTSTGRRLWQYRLDGPHEVILGMTALSGTIYVSTPSIVWNGVRVQSQTGKVLALRSSNGTTVWTRTSPLLSYIVGAASGVLIVQSDMGLEALRTSDGTQLWQYKEAGNVHHWFSYITVVNTTVFVAGNSGFSYADIGSILQALQLSNGARLWVYRQTTGVITLIGASSGTLYCLLKSDFQYKIAALRISDSKQLWSYSLDNAVNYDDAVIAS